MHYFDRSAERHKDKDRERHKGWRADEQRDRETERQKEKKIQRVEGLMGRIAASQRRRNAETQ